MEMHEAIDYLSNMKLIDLISLTKELEEKWGVSANQVFVQEQISPKEEPIEQTEFDVILTGQGPNRINVIKLVREIAQMGLKEAKEFVDNIPKTIKESVSKEEAEDVIARLQDAGAEVKLK